MIINASETKLSKTFLMVMGSQIMTIFETLTGS